MDLLQKIVLTLSQYRHFRSALAELKGYSDRELNELGLDRGDIARAAFEEAERRVPEATSIQPGPRRSGEAAVALQGR